MADDPILARVRGALRALYGDNSDRMVLFGSRARGDAREDSDYDVAVFSKSMPDRWEEISRLADLRVNLIDETGFFFDLLPFSAEGYGARTPLTWGYTQRREDAVKPETEQFLAKARASLIEAGAMLNARLAEPAGRTALFAAFHAAQALLFEREGLVVKTHNGVHTEQQRLTRDDREVDKDLRGFLSRSFRFKATADHGLDPLDRVTDAQASEAIAMAERFVAVVASKLAAPPP